MSPRLSVLIPSGATPDRIDKVLPPLLGESRATVQTWIEQGRVRVQGKACARRDRLVGGTLVEVEPGPPLASQAEPDPSVLFDCVYEDEYLMVVNKPAGLVVHPARGNKTGTLVNGLVARPGFARAPVDARDPRGALRPGIVHRIDKGTSGLLVVAKEVKTREGLKAQLAAHSVERVYDALTLGVPWPSTIRSLHGRHPRHRLKFTSLVSAGKHAVTHVAVLEAWPRAPAAYVQCRLDTGRTHQIRVHLSERALTPLLGDQLYGGANAAGELGAIARALGRQALHARTLGFVHPISGQSLRFEQPPADDFQTALDALRALG